MTDDAISLYSPIGEGGQLSGFDEKLIEYGRQRMSGEQMYNELGRPPSMTPARCVQRLREIVNAQDLLTTHEQMLLLMLDLVKLRDKLFEGMDVGTLGFNKDGDEVVVVDKFTPAWANATARVLREMRQTIESMSKHNEGEDITIRRVHAEMMMAAITIMFERFVLRLEEHILNYQEMPDRTTLERIFEEVMPLGFASFEKHVKGIAA